MSGQTDNRQSLVQELSALVSEARNPHTLDIDLMSTPDILNTINAEDRKVPDAVGKVIPEIAAAVEKIVTTFKNGGRLIYVGAGTSGRLGVLDAAECPPTFGVPPEMVVGVIAGGRNALTTAIEGAEDSAETGAADLEKVHVTAKDVVVGIAVSGRTPYVIGALELANTVGATTVALSCNPNSAIAKIADIGIAPVVGAEVLSGSTRLKSGTAQKLVLNMLTTASMIRLGKTYTNLMVDLKATNAKLMARAVRIVMQATDCTPIEAESALLQTDNEVKPAILILLTGQDAAAARASLAAAGGRLRQAAGEPAQ